MCVGEASLDGVLRFSFWGGNILRQMRKKGYMCGYLERSFRAERRDTNKDEKWEIRHV